MSNNFELINNQVSLLDLIGEEFDLKRSGKTYKTHCPFHEESTPSFTVFPQDNRFYCFGCEESGDVVDYVKKRKGFAYHLEAMQELAHRYNIHLHDVDTGTIKRKKQKEKKNRSNFSNYYKQRLMAADYLRSRGFSDKKVTNDTFSIGYNDKTNALVIPFLNEYGELVGQAERYLDEDADPKYKNSAEDELFKKSELLFNFNNARKEAKDKIFLVEGYFDCMAMYQLGIGKTSAYCSSTITNEQAQLLARHLGKKTKIYLIPDNDKVGRNAVKKNVNTLRKYLKNRISIISLPDGMKDMNDFLLSDQDFQVLKPEAFEKYLMKKELDDCLEIEDEYEVAHEWAKRTQNEMLRADMAEYLAERWNRPEQTVKDFMRGKAKLNQSANLATASEAYAELVARMQDKTPKIKMGLPGIDMVTSGMNKKEVCFLMGKSGSGKTTLILNWIYKAVMVDNYNVMFHSLEMPKASIISQLIQIHMNEPKGKVEKRAEDGDFSESVVELLEKLDTHLRIVDEDSQSLSDIEHYVNEANTSIFEEPVQIVFIDYFQYLKMGNGNNQYEKASETARETKALAKRLNTLMVVLTQVNRMTGGGGSGKMTKESSKDTSAIEDTSDYLFGIYRPASNPELDEDERLERQHEMYCQILKNRFGAEPEVSLYFDGMTKRIEDGKGRF